MAEEANEAGTGTDADVSATEPDVPTAATSVQPDGRARSQTGRKASGGGLAATAAEDESTDEQALTRDALLRELKKEVKQIMEESIVKRFVYEEANCVTALCAAVEACLAFGMRKRVLGLFGTSSTFALLHKVSKLCPPAAAVLRVVLQSQQQQLKDQNRLRSASVDLFRGGLDSRKDVSPQARYLWLRVALIERQLFAVVDFIAQNAARYYEPWALMADAVRGGMVASLLVGPCALELTRLRTDENVEPTADELVQRHRIHSGASSVSAASPNSPRRPTLQVRRVGSVASAMDNAVASQTPVAGREYVLSLHQNVKSSLLYGKNNVTVCPADSEQPLKGYLSLHQNVNGTLSVKWTPNELMQADSEPATQKHALWKHALNINLGDILYLHYHQHSETSGGSVVFVGGDGVQYPPVVFPSGQHPLAFLSCLENGLLPWSQLDPPLWLQRGKGKVFPRLKRRTSQSLALSNGRVPVSPPASAAADERKSTDEPSPSDATPSHDYVFRILPVMQAGVLEDMMDSRSSTGGGAPPPSTRLVALSNLSSLLKDRLMSLSSSPTSSPPSTPKTARSSATSDGAGSSAPTSPPLAAAAATDGAHAAAVKCVSAPAISDDVPPADSSSSISGGDPTRDQLQTACDSMRKQILTRAFYGWLVHCRHLKTIRLHLSQLVYCRPILCRCDEPLTESVWQRLQSERTAATLDELNERVYQAGMEPSLRQRVWPYLLDLLAWHEDVADKREALRLPYETMVADWLAVEAIVRQRDKDAFSTARERHAPMPLTGEQRFLSTDEVFAERPADDENGAPSRAVRVRRSDASTPEAGDGGTYTKELIDTFALNLHRIEKDVHRCDRNHPFFAENDNLEKLKNVMCSFVWENLEMGYIQGMCDLAAPLLVVFDDEVLTFGCFSKLMERIASNFPHGGGMDAHLANMRSLLQVMDQELFDLMYRNGDYTHFYFCYRWFLLDFKRGAQLAYGDIFAVWEVIWSARRCASAHFNLFFALGFLLLYRDIILDNNMDFTDIIKFYNEMAERHDARLTLRVAREQLDRLQSLIEANAH